jgi:PilZ domain
MTATVRTKQDNEALEDQLQLFHPIATGYQPGFVERRAKQRIAEPFPVRAWAVDAAGNPFNVECVVLNMSAIGIYLRMEREMVAGEWISLVVQLLNGPSTGTPVAVYGTVLRDDPLGDGSHGIAVVIREHRFL